MHVFIADMCFLESVFLELSESCGKAGNNAGSLQVTPQLVLVDDHNVTHPVLLAGLDDRLRAVDRRGIARSRAFGGEKCVEKILMLCLHRRAAGKRTLGLAMFRARKTRKSTPWTAHREMTAASTLFFFDTTVTLTR